MDLQVWWIWMVLAALFVIGEIFTAGFFILWFGVGAAVAGLLAMFGLHAGWQWGSFIIVSGILISVSRRFADKVTAQQPEGIGANRWIGKIGTVIEDINDAQNCGRIRLGGEEWRACAEHNELIETGRKVKVLRVEGTRVIVTELKEGA
ncbi:NfeD family protein [candidate division KSB1 bacterium]|nr:NfeD family protein [candidate division KSB1 bacterium]